MTNTRKDQQEILTKLGISALNPMQIAAQEAIETHKNVMLLSPTGTGKTIAFLLPVIMGLHPSVTEIQTLIIVPSRELALQISQVAQEMGSGYKINAVYGGTSGSLDKANLKHTPAVLIGTPGRIADLIDRDIVSLQHLTTIVLDEFDKSLETGFEEEMRFILEQLPQGTSKIVSSATQKVKVPEFVGLNPAKTVNFLSKPTERLALKTVPVKTNKLETLLHLLGHLGEGNGILFCNLKNTIHEVSDFLIDHSVPHTCFYGGLEQQDRERALLQFRNGTHRLLIATDLAARGIDIPALDYIIHFELPDRPDEFTHRNGRTARMQQDGIAYILASDEDKIPVFVKDSTPIVLTKKAIPSRTAWKTLYISGGRKNKISKGDIAGLFLKQGNLKKEELGTIEIQPLCAFVAVPTKKASALIKTLNNSKLKTKKVRISLVD